MISEHAMLILILLLAVAVVLLAAALVYYAGKIGRLARIMDSIEQREAEASRQLEPQQPA